VAGAAAAGPLATRQDEEIGDGDVHPPQLQQHAGDGSPPPGPALMGPPLPTAAPTNAAPPPQRQTSPPKPGVSAGRPKLTVVQKPGRTAVLATST
jgi:hypothetical protein